MQANLLRAKMAEAELSQRALARMLKMSENSLSAKILGYRSFDVKEVVKICQILGIESAEDKAQIFLTASSQK